MLRRWTNSRSVSENDEQNKGKLGNYLHTGRLIHNTDMAAADWIHLSSKGEKKVAASNQQLPCLHYVKELRDALGPLSGRSLKYCSDGCLRRYLDARNWNVDKSKKMLQETLKWRATYKPEETRWQDVAMEGETGKLFRASFHDRNGRTVLIMKPGKQNTTSIDNQIRHLVYLMENAILNLPDNQEQMAWLIDFTGYTLSTSVPIRAAREAMNVLQNHYPERLTVAFLYNPPRIFEKFWQIAKLFLDTKTIQKVKFVSPTKQDSVNLMVSYFDIDNLPTEFGGKATIQYDHEKFSEIMIADDAKTADFWGSNGHSVGAEVAPEPVSASSGESYSANF